MKHVLCTISYYRTITRYLAWCT